MTQAHWYTIYSKPQREEFAQAHLRAKGLEVFFPRLKVPVERKRQKAIVPLFPNYLFVRFDALSAAYSQVLWSPGVSKIIGSEGAPVALDDDIVDFLMSRTDGTGCIQACPNLSVGQQVRITDGPFNGLIGVISKPPDARGRVKILMKLLSRDLRVNVPVQFVECEWVM